MKSSTQKSISNKSIVKIVQHHFGDETKIGEIQELADGWSSVAYSIELSEKKYDIIIKVEIPKDIPIQIYEHKLIETEIRAIELVKNHEIGSEIPLPELLGYDLEGALIGRGYFITKKFEGIPLDKMKKKLSQSELANIEIQIGQLQSKLNGITGDKFGYFFDHPTYSVQSDSWATTFSRMMENLFKDRDNYQARLPFKPETIRLLLKKGTDALNQVKSPSFVHWDLWAGNIFVKEEDNGIWIVEGIIDFERAIWGDPLTESSLRGKKKKINLEKGYGKDLFGNRDALIRDAFYDLYLATTLLVEMYVRDYSPLWRFLYRLYGKSLWKPALAYLKRELL